MNIDFFKKRKSFSLIETLVASAIFVVFLTLIINIYLSSFKKQNFLTSFCEVADNLSFVLERMNREIRWGKDFNSLPLDVLTFTNKEGKNIIYRLSGEAIERSEDGGVTFLKLTSENVVVEKLEFHREGVALTDNYQPRITILVKFTSKEAQREGEKFSSWLQTTVSSRLLQIP